MANMRGACSAAGSKICPLPSLLPALVAVVHYGVALEADERGRCALEGTPCPTSINNEGPNPAWR